MSIEDFKKMLKIKEPRKKVSVKKDKTLAERLNDKNEWREAVNEYATVWFNLLAEKYRGKVKTPVTLDEWIINDVIHTTHIVANFPGKRGLLLEKVQDGDDRTEGIQIRFYKEKKFVGAADILSIDSKKFNPKDTATVMYFVEDFADGKFEGATNEFLFRAVLNPKERKPVAKKAAAKKAPAKKPAHKSKTMKIAKGKKASK